MRALTKQGRRGAVSGLRPNPINLTDENVFYKKQSSNSGRAPTHRSCMHSGRRPSSQSAWVTKQWHSPATLLFIAVRRLVYRRTIFRILIKLKDAGFRARLPSVWFADLRFGVLLEDKSALCGWRMVVFCRKTFCAPQDCSREDPFVTRPDSLAAAVILFRKRAQIAFRVNWLD